MQVKIVSTSDMHGYFQADDFQRPNIDLGIGLARAATVIKTIKNALDDEDAMITIDDGDFIQGSPLTNYIHKIEPSESIIYQTLADTIDYDVRILGNHEFNYGTAYLKSVIPDDAGILNANILNSSDHKPFIGEPYHIFTKKGIKIGVIGLTTKFIPKWERPENIEGLLFADPVEMAQKYITKIKDETDIIVLAYHGGFEIDLETGKTVGRVTSENQAYQLSQLQGIDALITGHQHAKIAQNVSGVPATQPGYRGSDVGVITLNLNEQKQIIASTVKLEEVKHVEEDPEIVQKSDVLINRVNEWLDDPVGIVGMNMKIKNHFMARLHGHPFIELVNDVQMITGKTDIAFTALFNNAMPGLADIVSLRDVMTNYVYPNTLVVERLSGRDIKQALEISARYFTLTADNELTVNPLFLKPKVQHYNYDIWSGITYSFDFSQPINHRVVSVFYHGEPIEDNRYYDVAMNNYRGNGSGNFPMFNGSKVIREIKRETADLIGDYLTLHPNIEISQPENLVTFGYKNVASEYLP